MIGCTLDFGTEVRSYRGATDRLKPRRHEVGPNRLRIVAACGRPRSPFPGRLGSASVVWRGDERIADPGQAPLGVVGGFARRRWPLFVAWPRRDFACGPTSFRCRVPSWWVSRWPCTLPTQPRERCDCPTCSTRSWPKRRASPNVGSRGRWSTAAASFRSWCCWCCRSSSASCRGRCCSCGATSPVYA